MTGEDDYDASRSPEGKPRELATIRHRQFIRNLDFQMQQRRKVLEMEALIKHTKEESLRKAALQNARSVLQPGAADKHDRAANSCNLQRQVNTAAAEAAQIQDPAAPQPPMPQQRNAGRLQQTSEIPHLPAPEAAAVAERLRGLVDAALNGTEPSASQVEKAQECPIATVTAIAEAEQPDTATVPFEPCSNPDAADADGVAVAASSAVVTPKAGRRPMWAVTEDEAEAMEAAEEDCLLDFAEQLDIDALAEDLSDAELAEAMKIQALNKDRSTSASENPVEWRRNFVRAMNCIANKAAAAQGRASAVAPSMAAYSEAPSAAMSTTASAAAKAAAGSAKCRALRAKQLEGPQAGQVEWDASTCVGDESPAGAQEADVGEVSVGADRRGGMGAVAEDLLRENPEFKHMHSARSLKVLLEQSASCERCEGADAMVTSEPILLSV